jgi:type I restriction enzyme S subunit
MTVDSVEGWTSVKLGDIGESLIGLTYSPTSVKPSGTLVLRSSNIQDGQVTFTDNVYVDCVIPDRIRVRNCDILICVRNGSRRLIGKSVMLDHRVVGQTFGAFMAIYRSDANPFLQYFFQSDGFKRQIDEHLGATINQITNGSLNSFHVTLPEPREQGEIAARLGDIDHLIANLERLIMKKQAITQGMMQQLLTGRTRLPGFTQAWRAYRMGSLGSTYSGLTGKTKDDFGIGTGRYVPFMAVMAETHVEAPALLRVRVTPGERQNEIRAGDLLFNTSSETPDELAMCAVAGDMPERTYLNSFCFGFRLLSMKSADANYLACLFRSEVGRKLMSALAQGATRYNLSKSQFRDVEVFLPEIDEQRAIASVLTEFNDEIDTLRRRLAKTKAVKQGMMQEFLTGRTRLPVAEPAS